MRNDLDFVADHLDRHLGSTIIVVLLVVGVLLSGCAGPLSGQPCVGYFMCFN